MNQMEGKRKRYSIISNMIFCINLLVLSGLIGEHGVGYLAGALECFFLLLLLTAFSMPEISARLIRTRMQKGQIRNAQRVLKTSLLFSCFYSITGSFFLFFCADFLMGRLFQVTYAAFTLRLLIPAYVLCVFSQALRGYFQGMGSAVPTGVSRILERIIWFVTGILFCILFRNYGEKVAALLVNQEFGASYAGAGVAVGLDLAMLFALLFLVFVYHSNKRTFRGGNRDTVRMSERLSEIAYMMIASILPYMAYGFLMRIPVIGVMALGQHREGILPQTGIGDCGAFYGKYLAVVLFLVLLLKLPLVPIEGMIQSAYRKEEYKYGRDRISFGTHFILMNGIFLAVMLAVLGDTGMRGFFSGDSGLAGKLFLSGSSLVVFLSLGLFFSSLLISQGRMNTVLLSLFAGVMIFFIYGGIRVRLAGVGLQSIVTGLCVSWLVICVANGFFVMRFMKWSPEWVYILVLPLGTAALSGIVMMLMNKALSGLIGDAASCVLCLLVGMLSNLFLLLLLKGIRREELMAFPGGRGLIKFAEIIHLL